MKLNHFSRCAAACLTALAALTAMSCATKKAPASAIEPGSTALSAHVTYVGDVARTCEMSGGAATMNGPLPRYPRATEVAADQDPGPYGGFVHQLISDDSYSQVSSWYRSRMPFGSERQWPNDCGPKAMYQTMQGSALFTVGTLGKDYRAAWVTKVPPDSRVKGWPIGKQLPRTIILLSESSAAKRSR